MQANDTAELIDRFNRAFLEHRPALLDGLIGTDCVMESIQPAPNGTRYEGGDACLAFWQALAADRASYFEMEDTVVSGRGHPLALQLRRWRLGARRQPDARRRWTDRRGPRLRQVAG